MKDFELDSGGTVQEGEIGGGKERERKGKERKGGRRRERERTGKVTTQQY